MMCMKRPQIGKNIKSYRVRARMTQQELAAVLATTQGHIGQVERGGRYPLLHSWSVGLRVGEVACAVAKGRWGTVCMMRGGREHV